MTIIITGAAGKMGSAVSKHLAAASPMRIDPSLGMGLFRLSQDTKADTIIHLADDHENDYRALSMTQHMLRLHNVKRFIFASSIMVDPACGVPSDQQPGHVAVKKAGEAWLEAWTRTAPGRIGVALRFGHYSEPGMFWDEENEALRLTERGLLWWIDRALAHKVEGFTPWIAMGDGGADKRHGFRASDSGAMKVEGA